MASDGRVRNGSAHGTRNGFHRRKRNFVGSAGQRKARGDPYGANLVLQTAPPLDLARMQEADRVALWHCCFKHWVFRTETRTSLHGGGAKEHAERIIELVVADNPIGRKVA